MQDKISIIKESILGFRDKIARLAITERTLNTPESSGKIIAVIGPRRSGKTYYLFSKIAEMRKQIPVEQLVYLNFEDERLTLEAGELHLVIDAIRQLNPDLPPDRVHFYFDEIQEVRGFEKFIRRMHDTVSRNIYLTGSSARLLGKEIATSLRGRALAYELLPFSFSEYLRYFEIPGDTDSARGRNQIAKAFDDFVLSGGFPEVLRYDETLWRQTLQSYGDIMIFRDIIERHEISQIHVVRDFLRKLISCNAMIYSINKYYNDLKSRGVNISKDTLYALSSHFEDAFLALPLAKSESSAVRQARAFKKYYMNDTGFVAAYSSDPRADAGRLLETQIFLEHKKHGVSQTYYSNGFETDFIVADGKRSPVAIQVCHDLNDNNVKREAEGILHAIDSKKAGRGLIVTRQLEETITYKGRKIPAIPAWKYVMGLQ